ncbi:MAG: alpha-galactosidase, partial [Bacteroidaceae bacterium]|nr:alpha-galactosidase [Bacteroidaceae bacterium]
MNKKIFPILAALGIAVNIQAQETVYETPTMGWSSWNTFYTNISEDIIKQQARAMVSQGFSKVGYTYVNIDDGFFGGRNKQTGELLIHPQRFPNGLKIVADYIHRLGLKAGIYSDAGANTCGNYYNGDVLSVDVGMYNYDERDAEFYFNECGFDFIKVDFCGGDAPQNSYRLSLDEKERYTAIHNAMVKTGRTDLRLNVCRWNYPGTWVHDVATSWRISPDINSSWGSIKDIIGQNLYLSAYCSEGHYNDMDMLEVGRTLSVEEDKTHFGMWCIMSSPLLIGCNMQTIKPTPKALLKNEELIALNQDPLALQAYVVQHKNDTYVLVKDILELHGLTRAVALYNPSDSEKNMSISFKDLELGGEVKVRDLYEHTDLGTMTEELTATVPAHGTRIYKLEAEERYERTLYEGECAYLSQYQEIRNNASEETAIYESNGSASGGMVAGWLGRKANNDLQWRNVYSKEGGEYTMQL